ncbi:MAG: sulfite exporter TauE/SafE family protein [Candidatus Obscuribacterales bacterium]|nr:sulfite exporter TauE/SafE family protein [Candidatus Obscuribacterales bacterium]
MNYTFIEIAKVLTIGFLTGVFSGGFGVGGGIVCTPLLRLVMGVSPHVAIGTTMALIIPTSISGAFNYLRKDLVDRPLSTQLMIPAVVGVLLGAALTKVVHGQILMLMFAGLLTISGLDLVFGIGKKLSGSQDEDDAPEVEGATADTKAEPKRPSRLMILSIGLLAGCLAGFFGVGGGFVLVPCLLYFFKSPIKNAFGTSLLVIATVSVPGTITHFMLGHVDLPLMLAMMGGAIVGSFVGSSVAVKVKDSWLRKAFGIIMLFVAVMLGWRELNA